MNLKINTLTTHVPRFLATTQKVTKFRAKIGVANIASQNLFRCLGYVEVGRSEVFQEITFELAATSEGGENNRVADAWQKLLETGAALRKGVYD